MMQASQINPVSRFGLSFSDNWQILKVNSEVGISAGSHRQLCFQPLAFLKRSLRLLAVEEDLAGHPGGRLDKEVLHLTSRLVKEGRALIFPWPGKDKDKQGRRTKVDRPSIFRVVKQVAPLISRVKVKHRMNTFRTVMEGNWPDFPMLIWWTESPIWSISFTKSQRAAVLFQLQVGQLDKVDPGRRLEVHPEILVKPARLGKRSATVYSSVWRLSKETAARRKRRPECSANALNKVN
mmetsp:Transcript_82306/g.172386  ORF Transcript_82306/g.172386 Transcript_82306/m.172386 type:complete len:237 (+) Transcript_82306:334-1044(+)